MGRESTRAKGTRGEDLARDFLVERGYTVIASNWRSRAGEIDLVMQEGDCLVFVEVKARQGEQAGRAGEALGRSQSRRILNAGEWFIQEHPEFESMFWRCDLVAITFDRDGHPSFDHFVNAIVSG
ncbi:MAG TPA: YraN family protein [Thermomicrobiales bacterium]|nr:YraN family protein [Thermomicrobiales bacterium]